MGEDFLKGDLFFINKETGETDKIGKILESEIEVPEIKPGGIIRGETEFEAIGEYKGTFPIIILKTITKKKAKKLLMSWGFQRNEAYIIDKLYMQTHKNRTRLELFLFCMIQKGIFESVEITEEECEKE